MSERTDVQEPCIDYLKIAKSRQFWGWRQNVGGRGKLRFGKRGTPDWIGLHKPTGVFCGIEFKLPGEKLKPEQEEFHKYIKESNGKVIVVEDPDHFPFQLDEIHDELMKRFHEVWS